MCNCRTGEREKALNRKVEGLGLGHDSEACQIG